MFALLSKSIYHYLYACSTEVHFTFAKPKSTSFTYPFYDIGGGWNHISRSWLYYQHYSNKSFASSIFKSNIEYPIPSS